MNIFRTLWVVLSLVFVDLYGTNYVEPLYSVPAIKQLPIIFAFTRHLTTQENANAVSHARTGETINYNASLDYIQKLHAFSQNWHVCGVYSGSSFRHYATAACLFSRNNLFDVEVLQNFDELDLGQLAGKPESEIYKSKELANLLNNPDYRIPYDDNCKEGESQNDTWKRVQAGLIYVVRNAMQRNGGISEIATSRITMNIIMRRLSHNPDFICSNIPNCGTFFFEYIPSMKEFSQQPQLGEFRLLNSTPQILGIDFEIPELAPCRIDPISYMAECYENIPARCVTPNTMTVHPVLVYANKRSIEQSPTVEPDVQYDRQTYTTFQLDVQKTSPTHKKVRYEPESDYA